MAIFAPVTDSIARPILRDARRICGGKVEVDTQSVDFSKLCYSFKSLSRSAFFQSMALRGPWALQTPPNPRPNAFLAPARQSGACPWPRSILSPRRLGTSPAFGMEP